MSGIPTFDPEDAGHLQTILDDFQWAYDGLYARLAQLPDPHSRQVWLSDIGWPQGRQEVGEPPVLTLQKTIASVALLEISRREVREARRREAEIMAQDHPRG